MSRLSSFTHLGDELVHRGYIWDVVRGTYSAPDGSTFTRDIVRSPGAVGVVPIVFDAEGRASVVLVRQYRPAFDAHVVEIPAGVRDVPDEPTETTARRELAEEVGLAAGRVEALTQFFPSAGMTDSVLHLFVATDLTPVERATHGPEEDDMEVLHMPLADAVAMVMRGEIHDAKTVIGVLMADRRVADGDLST